MLDPDEIQAYMLNVFNKEQISVEVVFNSVDIFELLKYCLPIPL